MKLTWFGGPTFRIHIGGRILLGGAAAAPAAVDTGELRAGVDAELDAADADWPTLDPARWRPRRRTPALHDDGGDGPRIYRFGACNVLIDAPGEAPLLLVDGEIPEQTGRWTHAAVVAVHGAQVPQIAVEVLERLQPRLLALAAPETEIETAIEALRDRLADTGLVALEPGMAVEV